MLFDIIIYMKKALLLAVIAVFVISLMAYYKSVSAGESGSSFRITLTGESGSNILEE